MGGATARGTGTLSYICFTGRRPKGDTFGNMFLPIHPEENFDFFPTLVTPSIGAPLTGDFSELSPVALSSKVGFRYICHGRFIYTKPNYSVRWKMSMFDSNHPAVFDENVLEFAIFEIVVSLRELPLFSACVFKTLPKVFSIVL